MSASKSLSFGFPQHRKKAFVIVVLCIALPVSIYMFSVFLRVSLQEQALFGRSYLIPLSLTARQYTEPSAPDSFGATTYTFERGSKKIRVYKQLINGFQHAYGSALVAFELGSVASDLVFRGNEYAEAYLQKDGSSEHHYLDTKKDLANNAVGRIIAAQAKALHLSGREAENYIIEQILIAIDSGKIINHYLDPRVEQLPSPEQCGCPGLPARPEAY